MQVRGQMKAYSKFVIPVNTPAGPHTTEVISRVVFSQTASIYVLTIQQDCGRKKGQRGLPFS